MILNIRVLLHLWFSKVIDISKLYKRVSIVYKNKKTLKAVGT